MTERGRTLAAAAAAGAAAALCWLPFGLAPLFPLAFVLAMRGLRRVATPGEAIRFGLGAVKGVGDGAVKSVLEARVGDGPFASLTDFCCRVDVKLNNQKVIEALIRSGCFDSLGRSRATLAGGVDSALEVAAAERKSRESGQGGLFADEATHDRSDRFPELPEWSPDERIRYEKETLGFYIT